MSAAHIARMVPPRQRLWSTRFFGAVVVLMYLGSRSGWHEVNSLMPHLLMQLGIILAAVGALGRLWCSSYVAGNKNRRLIDVGPYSLTRNPLYFFSFIGGLGIAITTETIVIPVIFTIWFFWYYRAVIAGEEIYLKSAFGTDFQRYRDHVPRLLPRRSGFREPDRWELSPRSFRRSLTEVVWFIVAAVLIHALHDIRLEMGAPALFTLY